MKTKYRFETFCVDIIGIQDSKSVNIVTWYLFLIKL